MKKLNPFLLAEGSEQAMAPHSSTLAWKIPWMGSLVGCSPWGLEESDTTERLHFHFSLSCIGEGNGNPHQCSWLENPRDGGAWWAAIYGVTQSQQQQQHSAFTSAKPHLLIPLSPLRNRISRYEFWGNTEIQTIADLFYVNYSLEFPQLSGDYFK